MRRFEINGRKPSTFKVAENLPRTPERPALRRRLLKLVEARVDPVAAQLKRQCQHFVAMFVTVMAVTDKGARTVGQRRKRLQKSFYRPARPSLTTIKRPEVRTSKRAGMRQLTIGGKTIGILEDDDDEHEDESSNSQFRLKYG